jgi:hypothetical protein
MEESRKHCLCHVITDNEIAIGCADVPAKSCGALAERPVRIRELALSTEQNRQRDGTAIERILGGYLELLAGCQWLIIPQSWEGPIVGDYSQNSLALNGLRSRILRRLIDSRLTGIDRRRLLARRRRRKKSPYYDTVGDAINHRDLPDQGYWIRQLLESLNSNGASPTTVRALSGP